MHKRNTNATGFTIIELLIVIVVIAILAAISIVAYSNIQQRAHDSAVQSDLSNFAKQIQLAAAESGVFPAGGRAQATAGGSHSGVPTSGLQPSISVSVSESSYYIPISSGSVNLTYCSGTGNDSGQNEFVITAKSKSDKTFQYSSTNGMEMVGTGSIHYPNVVCDGIGYPHSFSYGYSTNNGGWQSWMET